jgi:hypothetical protein
MYCSGKVRSRWRGAASRRLKFRPYRQAAAFVQSLGLRSQNEWRQYCRRALCGRGRRPDDIPAAPDQTYRNDGWLNWGEWLGTGTVAPQLRWLVSPDGQGIAGDPSKEGILIPPGDLLG